MDAVTLCRVPTTEDRRLSKAITRAPATAPDTPDEAHEPEVTIVQVDDLPYVCEFQEHGITSVESLHTLLNELAKDLSTCILRARPLVSAGRRLIHADPDTGDAATLADEPRAWVVIDLDSVPAPDGLEFCKEPHQCAQHMRRMLPPEFRSAACVWRATGSAGFKPGIRLHLWFLLTRPVDSAELMAWLGSVRCDKSVFRPNQPIFTADPLFVGAIEDPMCARIGLLGGSPKVHVPPITVETTPPAGQTIGAGDDPLKTAALRRWERAHPWTATGGSSTRYPCPACGSSDGIAVRVDGKWNCHSSKHAEIAPHIGTWTGSVYVGCRMEFQCGLSARELIPALKSGGYWLVPRLPAHFVPAQAPAPLVPLTGSPRSALHARARATDEAVSSAVPTQLAEDAESNTARADSNTASGAVNPSGAAVVDLQAYRESKAAQAPAAEPTSPKYVRAIATTRALCFGTEAIRAPVAYDERSHRVVLLAAPVWRPHDSRTFPRGLDDTDATDLCQYIYEACGYAYATRSECLAVLESLARDRPYDPVRDYLDGLVWAGTTSDAWQYLARVPGELLGVETTPGSSGYVAAAFARWCIAAVQRTYEPGCQFREVLTLIGDQAIGKSQLLRALCPDPGWFSDTVAGDGAKDSRSALDGTWIVEFAEVDKFMREDRTGSFKCFISTQVDKYRRSYAHTDGAYPRRCVFAATSNYPDLFVDSSGNSRFNVLCVTRADVQEACRRRDLIWSAAKALYQAGEPAYLQPTELVTAREAQREHYNENTVEALVRELWEAPAPTAARRPGTREDIGFDWHPCQVGTDGLWSVLTTEQMRLHLRVKGYTGNVDRTIRSVCRAMRLVTGRLSHEFTGRRERAWGRVNPGQLAVRTVPE